MKPYADCGPCTPEWIYERLADPLSEAERFAVLRKVMSVLLRDLEPSINLGVLFNRCVQAVEEFYPATCYSAVE